MPQQDRGYLNGLRQKISLLGGVRYVTEISWDCNINVTRTIYCNIKGGL